MRIAICTPCHGNPKAGYAECLAKLVAETSRRLPKTELTIRIRGASNLPVLRTALVDWSLRWGADFILFIDADQVFDPDALIRLLAHQKPIMGVNYARRGVPTGPTACKRLDGKLEWVWTTQDAAERAEIEEVDRIGFGLCLIRAEVFRSLPQPWFEMGTHIGEDYFFSDHARRNGISIFIDHAVSWETGHLHEVVFTADAALHDREEFLRLRPHPL